MHLESSSFSKQANSQIGIKYGSLQLFKENEGPIENYSSDLFTRDEVHKIAILDLRILNLDRNECNLLVRTKVNK
jgi:Phosphatidylinositol 3- and 4-kinase